MEQSQKQLKRKELMQGLKVFAGLALLTAVEYWIAIASGSVVLLGVTALAKVAVIATYFMHAGRLGLREERGEEGEHE